MKSPKKLLTKKRQKWADERGGASFKGTPLNVNKATQAKLQKQLLAMTSKMTAASRDALLEHFKNGTRPPVQLLRGLERKFQDWFNQLAPEIATKAVNETDRHTSSNLHESLKTATGGKSIPVTKNSKLIDEAFSASVEQNVKLIKSIPSVYFEKLSTTVMRSVQAGGDQVGRVAEFINDLGVVTEKRAKFIARDQVAKANMALSRAKMETLGVPKFEWLHSGGQNERKLHLEYDTRIFELNNPPVIDQSTGERGYPGQLPNCRCRMLPILEYPGPEEL